MTYVHMCVHTQTKDHKHIAEQGKAFWKLQYLVTEYNIMIIKYLKWMNQWG